MLHSTLLSHVILAVFLYICTVAALTDRELEKIISTAVSGDDAKGLRRYPNIEDIGEFKNRLDALEDLSDEGSEGFGSVGTEGETDGTYATAIRSKRDASLENSADVVHQYLAQKSQQNRNQNIKPYRNVKTLSKHSFAQTGLNHIKNVGNPREVQNTGKRFYRITRRNAPQQTFNKVQKMSQISEGTGRNDAHGRKRSVSHNNFKDKTNNILEKVRKCLLDESCLKRHVAKFVSKDLGKDNFKVQTRNVFCNRRGCGRKKRSAIGQDEGQLRDAMHDDNVRKRNFLCNRFGCATRTKKHALEHDAFYHNAAERRMAVSDSLSLLSLLEKLEYDSDFFAQGFTPDSYVSGTSDGNQGELYGLADRAATYPLSEGLLGDDDEEYRRNVFDTCGTSPVCKKKKEALDRLIAIGFLGTK